MFVFTRMQRLWSKLTLPRKVRRFRHELTVTSRVWRIDPTTPALREAYKNAEEIITSGRYGSRGEDFHRRLYYLNQP